MRNTVLSHDNVWTKNIHIQVSKHVMFPSSKIWKNRTDLKSWVASQIFRNSQNTVLYGHLMMNSN